MCVYFFVKFSKTSRTFYYAIIFFLYRIKYSFYSFLNFFKTIGTIVYFPQLSPFDYYDMGRFGQVIQTHFLIKLIYLFCLFVIKTLTSFQNTFTRILHAEG